MAEETTVAAGTPQWYYYLRNDPYRRLPDGWYQYDPELNQNVEQLYQAQHTTTIARAKNTDVDASTTHVLPARNNYFDYEINFSEMCQTNTTTGRNRPIARSVDGSTPTQIPEMPSPSPTVPRVHVPMPPMAMAAAFQRWKPNLVAVPLTELLRNNDKTLWKLKLYKENQFDDLEEFCKALQQNSTVTSVQVSWKFLRRCRDPSLLMESIGSLTNLTEMSLEVLGHSYLISCALRNASKLKSLRIGKLRFNSNQEIQEFATALQGCQSLRQIGLSAVDDAQGLVVVPQQLQTHQPNDTEDNNDDETKIRLDPLLDAMTSLPYLEHIRLQHPLNGNNTVEPPKDESLRNLCRTPRRSLIFNSCGLTDPQCIVLADELKKNKESESDLSLLVVTRNFHITPRGWDAFIDVLEVNYKIVDFHPGEEGQRNAPSPDQAVKIQYYLGLNQAGRGKFLSGSSSMTSKRDAWFDFLVRGRNDLNKVFFALQADPSLYLTTELIT